MVRRGDRKPSLLPVPTSPVLSGARHHQPTSPAASPAAAELKEATTLGTGSPRSPRRSEIVSAVPLAARTYSPFSTAARRRSLPSSRRYRVAPTTQAPSTSIGARPGAGAGPTRPPSAASTQGLEAFELTSDRPTSAASSASRKQGRRSVTSISVALPGLHSLDLTSPATPPAPIPSGRPGSAASGRWKDHAVALDKGEVSSSRYVYSTQGRLRYGEGTAALSKLRSDAIKRSDSRTSEGSDRVQAPESAHKGHGKW